MSIRPTYQLPASLNEDINKFAQLASDFKAGNISNTEFKAFRVPFGVYEQRQDGIYMARVRCTGGLIRPAQLKEITKIAQRHGSNFLHITTRGEIQIHGLTIDEVEGVQRELQAASLATKGGGGNTFRQIIVSEFAGILAEEQFDPTPWAVALTSKIVPEPESALMPRKLKFAFESNPNTLDYAAINDCGLVAKVNDKGEQGFTVYVGGGTGGKPTTSHKLYDFFPAEDVYSLASALRGYFSKNGNRKNKHQARLRYVFYKKGVDVTLREIDEAVKAELAKGVKLVPTDLGEQRPQVHYTPSESAVRLSQHLDKQYATWKKRYVQAQPQEGYVTAYFPIFLGNIAVEDERLDRLNAVLDFVNQFGDNTLRFTLGQGIRFRNIPEAALPELWSLLRWFDEDINQPVITSKLRSCSGADTCRLGLALSKNCTRAVRKAILESNLDVDLLDNVQINITGCPNSCAQPGWADLGFSGNPLRKDGRSLPGYKVYLQADKGENPRLGQAIGTINARDLPKFVVEVLGAYQPKAKEQTFHDYLATTEGRAVVEYILGKYKDFPSFDEDKNYYFDWGADEIFSVAPRGQAECSAGLFDMINVDIANIKDARQQFDIAEDDTKRQKELSNILYASARMLLVTRGLDGKTPADVYNYFIKNFIEPGYVPAAYTSVIELIRDNADADLLSRKDEIFALGELMPKLYATMDDSLEFKKFGLGETAEGAEQLAPADDNAEAAPAAEAPKAEPAEAPAEPEAAVDVVKDFRGVACPMNFVKTKIALAPMQSGQVLEIWLDDGEPINNVPGSVKLEGHTILGMKQTPEDYWKVVIKKK